MEILAEDSTEAESVVPGGTQEAADAVDVSLGVTTTTKCKLQYWSYLIIFYKMSILCNYVKHILNPSQKVLYIFIASSNFLRKNVI